MDSCRNVRVQVEMGDVQVEQGQMRMGGRSRDMEPEVVTGHACRGRALVTSLDGREAGTREGDPGKERPWEVLQS